MPEDIENILKLIADSTKIYGNDMNWKDEAELKSDMMKHTDRWRLVSTDQIREKLIELGMRDEDIETICDMHARRLQGRRLVPAASYRDFEFRHDLSE